MLSAKNFFDLSTFEHAAIFDNTEYAWQALDRIESYIEKCFADGLSSNVTSLDVHSSVAFGDAPIHIGEGTVIEPGAYIKGPAIIGRNCKIGQGAYVRANIITGDECVIGHATEAKNSIFFNHAHAPHFNYVGDSILGTYTNLGAGTKLSNLAVNSVKDEVTGKRPTIRILIDGTHYDTGLTKFGAILGDETQTGCNTVTNPGTLIGPRTLVYAMVSLPKGYYPGDSIIKLRQQHSIIERR
ncbi:MAG: glucose-1-phosphate thymidylyltransferase [Chloroflexi bacterium]|nr:MAG: glucose-1-phosphate thymidylyltransferase [Phototrophicales bacterium]RMF77154.1 MAG: glucose-1-phosphate thymidylyltransferase [Chloroflexota bacterium]